MDVKDFNLTFAHREVLQVAPAGFLQGQAEARGPEESAREVHSFLGEGIETFGYRQYGVVVVPLEAEPALAAHNVYAGSGVRPVAHDVAERDQIIRPDGADVFHYALQGFDIAMDVGYDCLHQETSREISLLAEMILPTVFRTSQSKNGL